MARVKTELSRPQAEELRLAIKELGWAIAHMRNFYNMSKPDEEPAIFINPNQLKLFENE